MRNSRWLFSRKEVEVVVVVVVVKETASRCGLNSKLVVSVHEGAAVLKLFAALLTRQCARGGSVE
jgi:hypothetical protein